MTILNCSTMIDMTSDMIDKISWHSLGVRVMVFNITDFQQYFSYIVVVDIAPIKQTDKCDVFLKLLLSLQQSNKCYTLL